MMGLTFIFPVNRSLCMVLSTIVSQPFLLMMTFISVAVKHFAASLETDDEHSALYSLI